MKRINKKTTIFFLLSGTTLLSGCIGFYMPAMIDLSKDPQLMQTDSLEINSIPLGADVYVDGDYKGKTPLTLSFSRDDNPEVCLILSGCEKVEFSPEKIDRNAFDFADGVVAFVGGTVLGSLLLTPWSGLDMCIWSECNDYKFSPAKYTVTLVKEEDRD